MPVLLSVLRPERNREEMTPEEYRQVFRELYAPLRNFIYFRCGDADLAEDLVQDTFLKLWEMRKNVDKATIKAYLYKIAQNGTINYQRRQQLYYKFIRKAEFHKETDTPEKIAEMNEYEQKLQNALGLLPEGGREVFLMNRLEDLTYTEISERLGLSVKAIEKRMSKALKILREHLGADL